MIIITMIISVGLTAAWSHAAAGSPGAAPQKPRLSDAAALALVTVREGNLVTVWYLLEAWGVLLLVSCLVILTLNLQLLVLVLLMLILVAFILISRGPGVHGTLSYYTCRVCIYMCMHIYIYIYI